MHLDGYSHRSVGNMLAHYTRHDGDLNQEQFEYRNQNIDTSRTHMNFAIGGGDTTIAGMSRRIDEAMASMPRKVKEGTSVLSDWVVTLPKQLWEESVVVKLAFFHAVYDAFAKTIGEENILGGFVHLDETTPHMHLAFMPITKTAKTTNDKSRPKLNADGTVKTDKRGNVVYERMPVLDDDGKPVYTLSFAQTKMFDRRMMQNIHPRINKAVTKSLSRFGIENAGIELDEDDKVGKALSAVPQDKLDDARKAIEAKLAADTAQARSQLDRLDEEVRRLAADAEKAREEKARAQAEAQAESERLERLRRGCTEREAEAESLRIKANAAEAAEIIVRGEVGQTAAAIEQVESEVRQAAGDVVSAGREIFELRDGIERIRGAISRLRDRVAAALKSTAQMARETFVQKKTRVQGGYRPSPSRGRGR